MGIGARNQKEIDTVIQSGTSPLFQYFLMDEQKTDITLTSLVTMDDNVINVSAGHGFVATDGEYMVIRNGDVFSQTKVVSVATNAITIEMPIANSYPLVGTTIIRGNINMNVDGSVTPVDFKCSMPVSSGAIIPIDISDIVMTMQHGSNVPDDAKFGGLTALPEGLYFRKVNGGRANLGNYQNNQRFRDIGAEVEYTEKAPSGTNGTIIHLPLEDVFGQVIRLDPRDDDCFLGHVRDDIALAEGMVKLTVSLIGSFTVGE
ncbi:hypothetical protein KA005_29070 [bacterium]|nr:hypothetical protein [bacterium]